jgi:hypothetical protein
VTEGAFHFGMSSGSRESGHRLVIEFRRSLGGDVASRTVSTELAVVGIVLGVTIHARDAAELIATVRMALFATNGLVSSLQRKTGVLQVHELGIFELLHGRVALGTLAAELVFVRVLVAVDARELSRPVDLVFVALYALGLGIELGMKSHQRKLGVLVVAEGPRALAAFDMAGGTWLVGKLILVLIAMLVATRAGPFDVGERPIVHMAPLTIDRLVFAEQGKAELGVVNRRGLPGTSAGMAPTALCHFSDLRVRSHVAVATGSRHAPPAHDGLRVAFGARQFEVFAFQRNLGELLVLPLPVQETTSPQGLARLMAVLALGCELLPIETVRAGMAALAVG